MHKMGYLGMLDLFRLSDAILCTTRLYFETKSAKVLVSGTLLSITISYKGRLLRAWVSAALPFLLPYCSGERSPSSSDILIDSFSKYLL